MSRHLASFLCLILGLASCTSSTTDTTSPPAGPGRIALVDEVGNVVVIDPDGSNRVEVAVAGEEGNVYAQPIWSPDGSRVSWAQSGPGGFAYAVSDSGFTEITTIEVEEFPFYAYWQPGGDRVALLRNAEEQVALELADFARGQSSIVDTDVPYYFSWSPEGDRFVSHAGANRLVHREQDGDQESRGDTSSDYLSPQWLPSGVLHVDQGLLVLDDEEGNRTEIVGVSGFVTFVANRQGTKVAIQTQASSTGVTAALGAAATIPPNSVLVVGIPDGEITTVAPGPAAAFFWSPDGDSLLILGVDREQRSLVASVWTGGSLDTYASYFPTQNLIRDFFPFFPQYAQSLSPWAADSTAFAFVGQVEGETGIWVQSLDEAEPVLVSGGTWVAWSS